MPVSTAIPYTLTRLGVVMAPEDGNPLEAEGVLNPASGRDPDGVLYLLPRLVAAGNVSRVGLARVIIDDDGVPVGVEREGVVLEPDRAWERGAVSRRRRGPSGHVRTGARAARHDVRGVRAAGAAHGAGASRRTFASWRRLGPALFAYDDDLDVDLNLFHNKDTVFFPTPVTSPAGVESLAVLHRPMWDLDEIRPGQGVVLPRGLTDERHSIWISYVPLASVLEDVGNLVHWREHRFLAGPEYAFEELKIGGGPAPLRVPEGWLLLHHGVTGVLASGVDQQQRVNYAAGALLLDADDPSVVLARTPSPLLAPETDDERSGIVPNVVFPTAIEEIGGAHYVFYGMADSKIGVARLDRTDPLT